MLPEAQQREDLIVDGDPAYDELATVFAPAAGAKTHARHLAALPPTDRASRGAVVTVFAIVAMLAGFGGLAAPRFLVTAVPTAPKSAPIVARLEPAPAPAPTPAVAPRPAAPAPIRLALSHPPGLPPVAPRPMARRLTPPPPASTDTTRSERTPHLTGIALTRALAQDVIDTRKLNIGILRDSLPFRPDATHPARPH